MNKPINMLAASFFIFIFIFSGNLDARREQNAGDIARALADRLAHALDFEDYQEVDTQIIADVLEEMKRVVFDSVTIHSKRVTVKKVGRTFKLVHRDSHYLLDFGDDEKAARLVWLLFRTYGIERMCYVGRPKSSFSFILTGGETRVNPAKDFYKISVPGKSPAGDYPAITSSYKNLKVEKFRNSKLKLMSLPSQPKWKFKIMAGNNVLFKFQKRDEAIASFVFIKLYGFNQKCIVFGGKTVNRPMFTFLRKVQKTLKIKK